MTGMSFAALLAALVVGVSSAPSLAAPMTLEGLTLRGSDGDDTVSVSSVATNPFSPVTITYAPGPTSSIATPVLPNCGGGGAPGVAVTCTGSISEGDPIVLDLGPGDDVARVGTVDSRMTTLLSGGTGRDTLVGGARADILDGGPDNDALDGGQGRDTLWTSEPAGRYRAQLRTTAVVIDLAQGEMRERFGGTERDTLMRIEEARGTGEDDIFVGDEHANDYRSTAGWDRVTGGAGDDVARVGGPGAVIADYSDRKTGRRFDVSRLGISDMQVVSSAPGTPDETDTYTQLEYLLATPFADTITTSIALRAHGGAGDDTLAGSPDWDQLYGNEGADRVIGGAGFDWLGGGDSSGLPPTAPIMSGDTGDDVVDGRDGERDQLSCGGGEDTALYDVGDIGDGISVDCENAPRPPTPTTSASSSSLLLPPGTTPLPGAARPPQPSSAVFGAPRLGLTRNLVRTHRGSTATFSGRARRSDGSPLSSGFVSLFQGTRRVARVRPDATGAFRISVRVLASARLVLVATDPASTRTTRRAVRVRLR